MTAKNSSNNLVNSGYSGISNFTVSITNAPIGQNYWYNYMNRIQKTTFWADSISFDILCNDKTREQLKRICLIASVQCEDNNNTNVHLKIVITSFKNLNRILPELQKHFPTSKKFKKEYIQQYKEFFGDV